MFTDIPWQNDGKLRSNKLCSFVFRVNEDHSVTKYQFNKFEYDGKPKLNR